MRMSWTHPLVAAMALLSAISCAAAQTNAPALDPLIAQLERGLRADPPHDIYTLHALRQLRDPALKPLFARYASSGPTLAHRREGIFALAELSSDGLVDTFLITRIEDPLDQLQLLGAAHQEGCLSHEQTQLLLQRPDLPEMLSAFLLLRATMHGASIDPSRAERLAASPAAPTRATGALILLKMGRGEAGTTALLESLELAGSRRDALVSALLAAIRREQLAEAGPFVRRALSDAQSDTLRAEALAALLTVDPQRGAEVWKRELALRSGDLASTLRLALAALDAWKTAPADVYDTLGAQEGELIGLLAAAGRAASTGESPEGPALDLIRTGYEPGVAWTLSLADALSDTRAATSIRTAVVRKGARAKPSSGMHDLAILAAEGLGKDHPEALRRLLFDACENSDESLASVLLVGALEASDDSLSRIAAEADCPGRASKALAAILAARTQGAADPKALSLLPSVADGWGGLSRARRSQAAWLALRHAGQDRAAMARLLSAPQ